MESEDLIEIVKQNPILYNRRAKCAIGMRAKKWAEIGAKYGVPGGQMQNRWRAIKDRYFLLKRRAVAYPGTAIGQQIKKYRLAESLSFVDAFMPKYNGLPPIKKFRRGVPSESWTRSHTIHFINQLSCYPLLYDKTHPYYTNNFQRLAAYQKIVSVLKRYRPELTPELIAKKIKTIKSQYDREKKEILKRKQKPGAKSSPKLWFYKRLAFLDEKRTYDLDNLTNKATNIMDEMVEDYEFENKPQEEDTEDEDEDEAFKDDIDEWVPSKNSTKPFEEIELKPLSDDVDVDDLEKETFEDKIEDVFDELDEHQEATEDGSYYHQEASEDDYKQERNNLYVKCTGLLENLAEQIKPCKSEKDDNSTQGGQCKCKNSSPSSMLGKMIEFELDKVSERIYVDAKWKIMRILEEAQKRSLLERQNQIMTSKYPPREFPKYWERFHTLLLIKELSSRPIIFDKTHPYHFNQVLRMAEYRKIASVLKRHMPKVTPKMVAKKIGTIRSQYASEKAKRHNFIGVPNTPKLWFYDKLRFLEEKRTYYKHNSREFKAPEKMDKTTENYELEIKSEKEEDDEDEKFNAEIDELTAPKDSIKPFEEVQLKELEGTDADREEFENEIEEVFAQLDHEEFEEVFHHEDHKETEKDNRNQIRNDLYVKCIDLLEILAERIKPHNLKKDDKAQGGRCNCKSSRPSRMLGKIIESELAKVSKPIYVDAKWKIIRILEDAQKKSLRDKQISHDF